jgi:hypothetical protein
VEFPFTIERTIFSPKVVPEVGGEAAGLAKGKLHNLSKGQVREAAVGWLSGSKKHRGT